jgi:hypothetical protein
VTVSPGEATTPLVGSTGKPFFATATNDIVAENAGRAKNASRNKQNNRERVSIDCFQRKPRPVVCGLSGGS